MSDFNEDRAYEMGRPGIQPEESDVLSEKEFVTLLRPRLTSDDIVNRAEYRRMREKERAAQEAVNRAARYPEQFCAHLLMDREKYPQTLMDKRKVEPFYLVDSKPKTKFDDRQPHESIGQYARRMASQFETDLVEKQKNDQDTRRGYLVTGVLLAVLIVALVWKFWL